MLSSVKPSATEPAAASPPDAPAVTAPASSAGGRALDVSSWQRHLSALTGWLGRQLGRPRTRLAVIGLVLLLVSVLDLVGSVWTLPLVIVGAAMVLIAWIGARLDGRFAVEWGEAGTQLEFRAQIKAAPAPAPAAALAPPSPAAHRGPAVRVPTLPQLDDSDVIEGEGHTVEIDVAELRALIVAAEAREAAATDGQATAGSAAGDGVTNGSNPAAASEQRDRPAA